MSALQERLRALAPWAVTRERDLLFVKIGAAEVLVVAADSDGGLGPKPADAVNLEGEVLGRFAARVPLLEIVAAGAVPTVLVDTLSVERNPSGEAILAGVLMEAATAGIPADAITGSTEENVPTVATGLGITVLGRARITDLRVGLAEPGDGVVLLGRPMSAPTDLFGPDHPEVLSVPSLQAALRMPGAREALPIGSSGVAAEIGQLAESARTEAHLLPDWPVAANQSGGPSTAALVALDLGQDIDRSLAALHRASGLPVWLVARLG